MKFLWASWMEWLQKRPQAYTDGISMGIKSKHSEFDRLCVELAKCRERLAAENHVAVSRQKIIDRLTEEKNYTATFTRDKNGLITIKWPNGCGPRDCYCSKEFIEDLTHRGNKSVWFTISEVAPDCGARVLLTDGIHVTTAEYTEEDGWSIDFVSMDRFIPKAWMPLPEVPR